MKQDIDGFIFSTNKNLIIVHQIFEFKSSHLSIISDIDKINNLLNFILKYDFKFHFKKSNDDIFRPYNLKQNDNPNDYFILTNASFGKDRFNLVDRYKNVNIYLKLIKD